MTKHNAGQVLMGSTNSSMRVALSRKGNIAAGLVARLKSDGSLSLAKADGSIVGVSLGGDLSNAGFTSFCEAGEEVPVQLASGFTPTKGAQVHISDTTGLAGPSGAGYTAVNAYYESAKLVGVPGIGTVNVDAALISFVGGL